jgi:thiol-disulfide isomerase/thioredoxin
MKKFFATVLCCGMTFLLPAQEGYEINVTIKPFKNQYIYLGHYFGKQMPIIDSVKLNERSEGVFKGSKKLGGGIYMIGFPDRGRSFEVLIGKNQKFSIIADTATISKRIIYKNSPENDQFIAYQDFMIKNGRALDSLQKLRNSNRKDSAMLSKQMDAVSASIKTYRINIIKKDPDGLLATLMKGMREPEVPFNDPASKHDSLFAYKYFKNHYWDGVNFWDDRIVRTPFFEPRIDKYFEQLVYPSSDSVIKEIDWMLGYGSASEEMQRFLLLKFLNRYLNQKYMWEDAVFVHLFEKYFSQKSYPWLSDQGKKLITDRAYSLMANITGTPASDVSLADSSGKIKTLYGIQAPYTVLVIWDPNCGHCKEVLPRIDSFYRAKWKAIGVQIYGLAKETDAKKSDWNSFISEQKLRDWTHVYYSKDEDKKRTDAGIPGYSQLFDVQSFPTLYLLDKDKRIIAKKLTEQQVDEIITTRQKKQ